jgi:hypothetical protein
MSKIEKLLESVSTSLKEQTPSPAPMNTATGDNRSSDKRIVLVLVIVVLMAICIGLLAYQTYLLRTKMINIEASTEIRFLNELSQELPTIKEQAFRCMESTREDVLGRMACMQEGVEKQLKQHESAHSTSTPTESAIERANSLIHLSETLDHSTQPADGSERSDISDEDAAN